MANKTITQVPLAAAHILGISFRRAGGGWIMEAEYQATDDGGNPVGTPRTVRAQAPAGVITSIGTLIATQFLATANSQEGT